MAVIKTNKFMVRVLDPPKRQDAIPLEQIFPDAEVEPAPPSKFAALAEVGAVLLNQVLPDWTREVQRHVRCRQCDRSYSARTRVVLGAEYQWACPNCGVLSTFR